MVNHCEFTGGGFFPPRPGAGTTVGGNRFQFGPSGEAASLPSAVDASGTLVHAVGCVPWIENCVALLSIAPRRALASDLALVIRRDGCFGDVHASIDVPKPPRTCGATWVADEVFVYLSIAVIVNLVALLCRCFGVGVQAAQDLTLLAQSQACTARTDLSKDLAWLPAFGIVVVHAAIAVVVKPIANFSGGLVNLRADDRTIAALRAPRGADAVEASGAVNSAPRIAAVDRAITVVVEAVADFGAGGDHAFAGSPADFISFEIQQTSLDPALANANAFGFCICIVAAAFFSGVAIVADEIFVGPTVTVIVFTVANFCWWHTAFAAGVQHALVDATITVVVTAIAHLTWRRATLAARVADTLVNDAVAIVVLVVALFCDRFFLNRDALHPHVASAPGHTWIANPRLPGGARHRFFNTIIADAVAVIVHPVADLGGAVSCLHRTAAVEATVRADDLPVVTAGTNACRTGLADVAKAFVGAAVAVVVHTVADFLPRLAGCCVGGRGTCVLNPRIFNRNSGVDGQGRRASAHPGAVTAIRLRLLSVLALVVAKEPVDHGLHRVIDEAVAVVVDPVAAFRLGGVLGIFYTNQSAFGTSPKTNLAQGLSSGQQANFFACPEIFIHAAIAVVVYAIAGISTERGYLSNARSPQIVVATTLLASSARTDFFGAWTARVAGSFHTYGFAALLAAVVVHAAVAVVVHAVAYVHSGLVDLHAVEDAIFTDSFPFGADAGHIGVAQGIPLGVAFIDGAVAVVIHPVADLGGVGICYATLHNTVFTDGASVASIGNPLVAGLPCFVGIFVDGAIEVIVQAVAQLSRRGGVGGGGCVTRRNGSVRGQRVTPRVGDSTDVARRAGVALGSGVLGLGGVIEAGVTRLNARIALGDAGSVDACESGVPRLALAGGVAGRLGEFPEAAQQRCQEKKHHRFQPSHGFFPLGQRPCY